MCNTFQKINKSKKFNARMRLFRKRLFRRLNDFKFSKNPYLLSEETIKEYEYVKKLFLNSIDILENFSCEDISNSLSCIRQLISYYEKSDTLVLSLINEMFKTRFIETIEKRYSLFEILNKLFRMFYLFDSYRNNFVDVFHAFSILKIKKRNKMEEKDILKYSTFCCVAMPMARLFISYFTADGYEVYHPVILKRRPTMFITETKKDYLFFINSLVVKYTDLKYVKIFLCSLYEKIYNDNSFDQFYESLKRKERNYYCDILSLN